MRCELVLAGKHEILVKEDTQFVLDISNGGDFEVTLVFDTPGVKAELIGLYVLKGSALKLKTTSKHIALNTSCEIKIKGVLYDSSSSDYIGSIIIDKQANQTSSFLHDDVLVVGENTLNSSQPILEIAADEVKASHGATTGRINKEQTYYLMSRGLSLTEAHDLISEGFLQVLLSEIISDTIKKQIASLV